MFPRGFVPSVIPFSFAHSHAAAAQSEGTSVSGKVGGTVPSIAFNYILYLDVHVKKVLETGQMHTNPGRFVAIAGCIPMIGDSC